MPLHKPLLRRPLLRKSPVRTRALLSANRANALKSTGPRTSRGKHASALNALRHGRRARLSLCWVPQGGREADAFWRFEAQLRDAILPLAGKGEQHVFEQALSLWITKRLYDRLAASADEDQRLRLALGLDFMPPNYRSRTRRPGKTVPDWMVTVSIGVAWGRGLGRFQQVATEIADDLAAGKERLTSRCSESGPSLIRRPMPRLPSLHARLLLTTVGHPYSDKINERQGAARLDRGDPNRRTKPECLTKDASFENEADPDLYRHGPMPSLQSLDGIDRGPHGPNGVSLIETEPDSPSRSENSASSESATSPKKKSRRTKPECARKGEASKNAPTNRGEARNWIRRAISRARRLFDRRRQRFNEKRFPNTGHPPWRG